MASILKTLSSGLRSEQVQPMSGDSMKWLMSKIAELKNPLKIPTEMSRDAGRGVTRFGPGKLYCFYYDPKGKSEMPYYDRFPLVLVLQKEADGFLGLNLHYLPINYRIAFLGKLLKFAILDDENNVERLRVSYDILSASRRLKEFKPCLKKYLTGHIQSRLLAIQPDEWEVAAMLPMQQFRKATVQEVWQDSTRKIRKN